MVDVFISYSRLNQDRVRLIADAVGQLGYDVWWDAELPPHKSYGDVITEKIGLARAAIVVWSQSAVESEWVRAEADVARNQKKLVQTALDDVFPPMPFNQIQFAQLKDWQGEHDHPGWRKVRASLAELCGPPGEPRPVGPENTQPGVPPPTSAWRNEQARGNQPNDYDRAPAPFPSAAPASSGGSNKALVIGLGVVALLAVLVAAWFAMRPAATTAEADPAEPVTAQASPAQAASAAPANAPAASETADNDLAVDVPDSRFDMFVTVADPDGFSNLREQPSLKAKIIGRIMVGSGFSTFRQPGNWWLARLPDGTTGYVARSRIRIPGGPEGAPPPLGSTQPVQQISQANDNEQIIPGSNNRLLTNDDVAALDPETLRLARNEIYARKGKRFQNAELRAYFTRQAWYRPVADDVQLNSLEQRNVELIQSIEALQ